MTQLADITFTYPMALTDAKQQYEVYGSGDEQSIIVALDADNQGLGYIEIQSDGSFYVICERNELVTKDFHEAASFLFNNWIKYLQ